MNKAGEIRFGLAGIKGVGVNVVQAILEEREANGEYKSIYDLVERINLATCNRKVLDNLALSGAFDCFEGVRRESFKADEVKTSFSEELIRYGQRYQLGKASQEASLFGSAEVIDTVKPEMPLRELWPDIERLNYEKDLVGMYLSAHPLDRYYMELTYGCNIKAKDFGVNDQEPEREYRIGGLIVEVKKLTAKTGSQFGIFKIEDYTGSVEIRLFGQDYINYNQYGIVGNAVIVTYAYQTSRYNPDKKYMAIKSIELVENLYGQVVGGIQLNITEADVENVSFQMLLDEHVKTGVAGAKPFYVNLENAKFGKSVLMSSKEQIVVDRNLLLELDEIGIGYDVMTNKKFN